ncbi:MAG: PEP-CTERM sorting domain-containing protein [Rhodocyclaceae bacterium]|nr:PEP-CTERM sorting domain-containing protein [Rhodocyclaceae bacterium]
MKLKTILAPTLLALGLAQSAYAADVIQVSEDVMTSPFFTAYGGNNTVRGYGVESGRPVLRVSNDGTNGMTGAETIYLSFNYDFSAYTGPVTATLTMQSTAGGFGADASLANPFLVSAHGVDANPFTSIIDNTNTGGSTSWLNFYSNNILAADAAARTTITGEGAVSFDVSAIVNSWIAGSNSFQFIALTGKNDVSGNDFLHGFLNNNDGGTAMGYTFLTVAAVPEPETYAMLLAGLGLMGSVARRRKAAAQA